MKKIILASSSARRKMLLDQIGLKYTIDPSNYEEDMTLPLLPYELAMKLALGKAQDVAPRHKNAIVIGADSMVIFDGKVYGKPHSPERAKEMLSLFQGTKNQVVTGIALIDTESGEVITDYAISDVHMMPMTPTEINAYIATEEPLERAGAYAAQELGSIFIERINGDMANVIGLPVKQVYKHLKSLGYDLLDA